MHSDPMSSVFLFGEPTMVLLLAIPLLGLLLAAIVTLIAIRATRTAGWVLLALLIGVPLVLGPVAGFFWVGYRDHPILIPSHAQAYPQEQGIGNGITMKAETRAMPASSDVSPGMEITPTSSPDALVATNDQKQPLDKAITAESARLIDALSKVLAKTIIEDPKAWREIADNAAKKTEQLAEKADPSADPPPAKPETKPAESATPEPPAPDWVGKSWHQLGNSAVFERDVEVYPYSSRLEADAKLPEAVQKAVDEFVEIAFPDAEAKLRLPPERLRQMVKDTYEQWRTIRSGDFLFLTLHARIVVNKVELEPDYKLAQKNFAKTERSRVAERRLWHSTPYFFGGFLLLATVWGYLKVDLTTGGRRRGVLRLAGFIAILSIVAAAALAALA
jgi:hypothetical protein